jgi:hypothetical protein
LAIDVNFALAIWALILTFGMAGADKLLEFGESWSKSKGWSLVQALRLGIGVGYFAIDVLFLMFLTAYSV